MVYSILLHFINTWHWAQLRPEVRLPKSVQLDTSVIYCYVYFNAYSPNKDIVTLKPV